MVMKSYDEIKASIAHGIKSNFFQGTLMHRQNSNTSMTANVTIPPVHSSGSLEEDRQAVLNLITSAIGELDFKNVNAAYAAIEQAKQLVAGHCKKR
jgi:hypothetical protein